MEVDLDSSTFPETTVVRDIRVRTAAMYVARKYRRARRRETTCSCCRQYNLKNHKQLEWVQCDYCIRWFHSLCAKVQHVAPGLQERQLRCPACHEHCIVEYSPVMYIISCCLQIFQLAILHRNKKALQNPKKYKAFYKT
ncbi:hypothetical protein CLF_113320 [Clonorchis sinensis]|uniref:PHD-type domain-containing protein n=1 Tax=Clonorchis sinensis TaxID=79923 RepID=G7YY62_CLOSI|nr:hypothetical protein CLF_113320 [Clonorchis sinensis]